MHWILDLPGPNSHVYRRECKGKVPHGARCCRAHQTNADPPSFTLTISAECYAITAQCMECHIAEHVLYLAVQLLTGHSI